MATRTRKPSQTGITLRRGIKSQMYGCMSGAFNQKEKFGGDIWNKTKGYQNPVPVAIDYEGNFGEPNLLVPAWAYTNAQKALFVANFAGLADTCFDGKEKRVTIISAASGAEFNTNYPADYPLHTTFTLGDGDDGFLDWCNIIPTDDPELALFCITNHKKGKCSFLEVGFDASTCGEGGGGPTTELKKFKLDGVPG